MLLASVLDGLLGAGAGQGADLELGVAVLGLRLALGDRAEVAEQEAQRDRGLLSGKTDQSESGNSEVGRPDTTGEKNTSPTAEMRPP